MRIEFVFPYPPTVNTYWRRRGSTSFVSKAVERYRRDVPLIVRQQRLKLNLSGSLAITTISAPPDSRRRAVHKTRKLPL
ncbi:RusA family crossover junction endodeoxyribonuclease, partial [Escherichia coli]|uniref:RusA family crossover junction endodeoxyribonuclease n=1 Tax=Escherichia coli TaxID=562 RepID=UPI00111E252E